MKKPFQFRLPGDEDRIVIVGQTGTGKTHLALWLLSQRSFDRMPWVIIDFKHDNLIAQIPFAQHIGFDTPLDKPGLYVLQPHPTYDEDGSLENWLYKIWTQENIGLFIDEGAQMGNTPAFRAILSQGRSKRIPPIILSQRPKGMSLSVFTETQFFSVFYLVYEQDRKRVKEYFPSDVDVEGVKDLPEHQSYWYDVRQSTVIRLRPVPPLASIMSRFNERLAPVEEVSTKPQFAVL